MLVIFYLLKILTRLTLVKCSSFLGIALLLPTFSLAGNGREVMLYDLYHRQPIQIELMEGRLRKGFLNSMIGRYLPYDRAHGNAYSLFRLLFSDEFVFKTTQQSLSSQTLDGVNILVIINPDSNHYLPEANLFSEEESEAIRKFVYEGGGLFITANSWTDPETFEIEQTNMLLRYFGIEFEKTWTPYYKALVPEDSPFLFNVSALHYGGGNTIKVLDGVSEAEVQVILSARKDEMARSTVYPAGYDRAALGEGPIVTMSRYGKGRVIAVGDSGTWALDDLAVAGADNVEILKQLVRLLRTPGLDLGYRPTPGQVRQYESEIAWFLATPNADLLGLFHQPERVKKESLPAGSWPDHFIYDFLDFEVEIRVSEKDARDNTHASLSVFSQDGREKTKIAGASFSIAPKGQILSREEGSGTSVGKNLLEELVDSFTVTFSDPLIQPGSAWQNMVWIRALPLERGARKRALRQVTARHILDSVEARRGQRCAKIVTYATLDLSDLRLSDLVSPESLLDPSLGKFRIEQGMQVLERVQYFSLEDGDLIESESYNYSRLWLEGLGFRGDDQGYVQLYERVTLRLK